MSIVSPNSKTSNNLFFKNQNCSKDAKIYCTSNVRAIKSQMRAIGSSVKSKDINLNTVTSVMSCTITSSRISSSLKRCNGGNDNLKASDQRRTNGHFFGSARVINSTSSNPFCDHATKSKDFGAEKFQGDADPKIKSSRETNCKEVSTNHQDYKSRTTSAAANRTTRFHQSSTLHRETHSVCPTQSSRQPFQNDNSACTIERKTLEQQSAVQASINFPPLCAPQSIVNVQHPFVTEARTKHNALGISNAKSKLNVQSGSIKDIDPGRQTYHGHSTSTITSLLSLQSLGSITANLTPYPRPDSFSQPTVAGVLFPETAQFTQTPPFSTAQAGQLNQFQTYDPGSFATTPVNANPVIPQCSAESSIPYSQYENPQFVQPNHYPSADIASSRYQYQTSVSQIQDSSLLIQSLQSPVAIAEQYSAPNYARAVRTELLPRLRRPPRVNK